MYSEYFEKRLAIIAFILGIAATVGSLLIVLNVGEDTFNEIEDRYKESYLATARSYTAILTPDLNLPDSILFGAIRKAWKLEADLRLNEYLCIVDETYRIMLHSNDPKLTGRLMEGAISQNDENMGANVQDVLSRMQKDYVGVYYPVSGEAVIAAFVVVPGRKWVLGVYGSKGDLEAIITEELKSQNRALLGVSLGIIPLTLGFLYFLFLRISRNKSRAEQELLESAKALGPVLENAVDPIYRFNLDLGKFDYFSPSCQKTYGYSPDQLIQTGIDQLCIHEDDVSLFKSQILEYGQNQTYSQDFRQIIEYRYKHKTQGYRWFSDSRALLTNAQGRPIAIIGSIRDITEYKLSELALRRSEEINRSITESAGDAIVTINHRGQVLEWNKAATEMFGYTQKEMISQKLSLIIPHRLEARHTAGLERLAAGGKSKMMGKVIKNSAVRKDGSEFNVEFSLSRWQSENQDYYTGVIRDTTQRELAESELFDALHDAKLANNVKDQFIANISHEIRTPITSIIGFLDLIKNSLQDNYDPNITQFFEFINNSTTRLLRTVDSILNISQLKAGKIQLNPKQLELTGFCSQICDELRPSAYSKSLFVKFNSTVEHDAVVLDEVSMFQAISNIIDNAIKYTHKGGVTVQLDHRNGQICLRIQDTGIGISEEYYKNMFHPFSQESEGFTKNYQGIGLGLALTKQYLDLNKVSLSVESKKGEGSTFTLLFPKESDKQNDSHV